MYPQLSSGRRDSLSAGDVLMDEDGDGDGDVSRTQAEPQEGVDLFDDGDGPQPSANGSAHAKGDGTEVPHCPGNQTMPSHGATLPRYPNQTEQQHLKSLLKRIRQFIYSHAAVIFTNDVHCRTLIYSSFFICLHLHYI